MKRLLQEGRNPAKTGNLIREYTFYIWSGCTKRVNLTMWKHKMHIQVPFWSYFGKFMSGQNPLQERKKEKKNQFRVITKSITEK